MILEAPVKSWIKPPGLAVGYPRMNPAYANLWHRLEHIAVMDEGVGAPRELMTGLRATAVGSGAQSWIVSPHGLGTSATDGGWSWTVPGRTLTLPYTLFGVVTPQSVATPGFGITMIGTSATGGGGTWIFRYGTDFRGYSEGTGTVWVATDTGVAAVGQTFAVVAVDDGTAPRMVVKNLTTGTISRDITRTTAPLSHTATIFGVGTTGYSEDWTGEVYLAGWASRAWTLDEMYQWVMDPFGLIRRAPLPIQMSGIFFVSGGGHPAMRRWTQVPGMRLSGRGW